MDEFARLPPRDRRLAFDAAAAALGLTPLAVEKDFWSCRTLRRLFAPPAGLVFKGGTSLSKVYRAVERFSEDLDLTFDRASIGFGGGGDPASLSGKARKHALSALAGASRALVAGDLLPLLRERAAGQLGDGPGGGSFELDRGDANGLTVLFHYPGSGGAVGPSGYLRPRVKLEFGGRGGREPSEPGTVTPYAAGALPAALPDAATVVAVLRADRTFWEKATALHMLHHGLAAGRPLPPAMSRHYYDVAMLSRHPLGRRGRCDAPVITEAIEALPGEATVSADLVRGDPSPAGYHRRVERFIREHGDHITVRRLTKNVPVTAADLAGLEAIPFSGEGVGDTRDRFREEFGGEPLGLLVRRVVGLDRRAAKAALADFLREVPLSADQQRFAGAVEAIRRRAMA